MSTDQSNIEALIKGCKLGDKTSQESLYKLYYGYAMGIALRYSGSREEAMEILNDGFLKVFVQLQKGSQVTSFKAWLRRILINTSVDRFRKEKNKIKTIEIVYASYNKDSYSILDYLSEQEIINFIQRLSPGYRIVFNLFVLEGYSHKEISKKLGIAVSTSKANLSKAKASLRKLLPQLDPERFEQYG